MTIKKRWACALQAGYLGIRMGCMPYLRVLPYKSFGTATTIKAKRKVGDIQTLVRKVTKKKRDPNDNASPSNILLYDIEKALAEYTRTAKVRINLDQVKNPDDLMSTFFFTKTRPHVILEDLRVIYLASDGSGLALAPKSSYALPHSNTGNLDDEYIVVKIPKVVPNDVVTVRLLMHHHFFADSELISISRRKSNLSRRRANLIVCENFHSCSGCTFQMLTYDDQLQLKEELIIRAFEMFHPKVLDEFSSGEFGQMIGSPLQYAYRTKLTPHYNVPRSQDLSDIRIGFNHVNLTKKIVDIESCPIATQSINQELPKLRSETLNRLHNSDITDYKGKGHTLLLRESIRIDHQSGNYESVCVTDHRKVITQKIDDFVFQFPASEFFQNNSSIMPYVLDYIRFHIHSQSSEFKFLIDTYCGSGFFGISLSKDISPDGKVFGIEISKKSILYAEHNAKLNGLNERALFLAGNSEKLFDHEAFLRYRVNPDETLLIMDPSRKGSNENFLGQILEFGPKMLIYISCNVFTQARDLALLNSLQDKANGHKYKVKHLAGFDFFPQTKHVETIAILERIS